jgi:hypothetical protein
MHGVISQNIAIFNKTELSKIRCDSVKVVRALNTYGERDAPAASPSGKEPLMRLGTPQCRSGRFGENNLLTLPEFENRIALKGCQCIMD